MPTCGLPVSSSQTSCASMPLAFRSCSASWMPLAMLSPIGASGPVIELITPSLTGAACAGSTARSAAAAKRMVRVTAAIRCMRDLRKGHKNVGAPCVRSPLGLSSAPVSRRRPPFPGEVDAFELAYLDVDAEELAQRAGPQDLRFGPVVEHAAAAHGHHPVDLGHDVLELVGHEHQAHALPRQPGHGGAHLAARADVEAIRGLVQHPQPR